MKLWRIIPVAAVLAIAAVEICAQDGAEVAKGVHEITLPRYQPNLPPGPGRQAFATCCLACHTDRYISTQPKFPEAKWNAEVKKMGATYGCYITAEQEPLIVQYCLALQKSPKGKELTPVPPMEAGPEVQPINNPAAAAALFAKDCAICHVAAVQHPAPDLALPLPADLSRAVYSTRILSSYIHNSVPGTAMPAYSYLNNTDLATLIGYVQSTGPKAEKVTASAEGKAIYEANCLSCHGAEGTGDGYAGVALPRPPVNFQEEQPTGEFAFKAISDGIAGTSMPQWKTKLSEEQRREVARYVRGMYRGG